MTYTIFEHRHNFAAWAAGRASSRGITNATVENLKCALKYSGLLQFCKNIPDGFDDVEALSMLHNQWCEAVAKHLAQKHECKFSYGRAAKLVNVYLKSMIVMVEPSSPISAILHPPIDAVLLKALAKKFDNKQLGELNWTEFSKEEYLETIETLKALNGNKPFWQIEEYWIGYQKS